MMYTLRCHTALFLTTVQGVNDAELNHVPYFGEDDENPLSDFLHIYTRRKEHNQVRLMITCAVLCCIYVLLALNCWPLTVGP